jgi:hypothetical protein
MKKFFLKNITNNFTLVKILVGGLGCLIVLTSILYYFIPCNIKIDFVSLCDTCYLNESIVTGFLGLMAKLGVSGIVELNSIVEEGGYSTISMTMGPNEPGNSLPNINTIGNNSGTNYSGTSSRRAEMSNIENSHPSGILPSNYGNPIVEWLFRARNENMREITLYKDWLAERYHFYERANITDLMANLARLDYDNYKCQSEVNRYLQLSSRHDYSVEINYYRNKIAYNNDIIYHLKYNPDNINSQLLGRYLNERRNY